MNRSSDGESGIDLDGIYDAWASRLRDGGDFEEFTLEWLLAVSGFDNDIRLFEELAELSTSFKNTMALELLMAFGKLSPAGVDKRERLSFELYKEHWHRSHEEIGWAIRESSDPRRTEAMLWLARWLPSYSLAALEARPLAVNMVYGLASNVNDESAIEALRSLACDADQVVSSLAREMLDEAEGV